MSEPHSQIINHAAKDLETVHCNAPAPPPITPHLAVKRGSTVASTVNTALSLVNKVLNTSG